MKRLKKLQCELPTSSVLNRQESISLKGGGDVKRRRRPGAKPKLKLKKVGSFKINIRFGG